MDKYKSMVIKSSYIYARCGVVMETFRKSWIPADRRVDSQQIGLDALPPVTSGFAFIKRNYYFLRTESSTNIFLYRLAASIESKLTIFRTRGIRNIVSKRFWCVNNGVKDLTEVSNK